MEAASLLGEDKKAAAGCQEVEAKAKAMERKPEDAEEKVAAGPHEEKMVAPCGEPLEFDYMISSPAVKNATTAMSQGSTDRGSTPSANIAYNVVFDRLIDAAASDAVFLDCSCAKIGEGTLSSRDPLPLDLSSADDLALSGRHGLLLYGTSAESRFRDAVFVDLAAGSTEKFGDATPTRSARDAVFLECSCAKIGDGTLSARDGKSSEFGNGSRAEFRDASLSARGSIFLDLPAGSTEKVGDATLDKLDFDEVDLHAKNVDDSPLTDITLDLPANGEGSGKKMKKYVRMERFSSVFPTAAPSRRAPARVVRSFKDQLIPIDDPTREIAPPAEPVPPAEIFEDPVLRLDASVEKVTQKKADLLQSEEVTPSKLRKLDRDLKHLSVEEALEGGLKRERISNGNAGISYNEGSPMGRHCEMEFPPPVICVVPNFLSYATVLF